MIKNKSTFLYHILFILVCAKSIPIKVKVDPCVYKRIVYNLSIILTYMM
jgi:hypothetical protein